MIAHLIDHIKQDSIKFIKDRHLYRSSRIEYNTYDNLIEIKTNIYFIRIYEYIKYTFIRIDRVNFINDNHYHYCAVTYTYFNNNFKLIFSENH